jgi:hypothetical protein
MKKLAVLITCFLMTLGGFAQSFEHPVAYNNFIVEEMNAIVGKNLDYISQSVHSDNFEAVEVKRKSLVQQIQTAYTNISKATPYEKGEKLQSECVEVLNLYKDVFETEYQQVNILKQSSEGSFEAMEVYFMAQDKAEKNLSKATERFYKAQKNYIKIHDIPTGESNGSSALEKQFEAIAEVNAYTRKLYLIYFQMTKYGSTFLDAVGQDDKGGIDGKRKRLEAVSDQALEELSQMQGFKGDDGLLNATIKIAKFYNETSKNGFVDVVTVVRAKQADLTQADVDGYNEAIESFNKKFPGLVNEYNAAQTELMKKHVPKGNVVDKKIKRT